MKRLEKDHPKSKTHTHVCLISNCTDTFVKFLKDPKKDYFITTPVIAHFSKFCTGMEEDVLMSNIKAGKPNHDNKKSQKQFNLIWYPVPKLIQISITKRV